jgi:hypothetical protein
VASWRDARGLEARGEGAGATPWRPGVAPAALEARGEGAARRVHETRRRPPAAKEIAMSKEETPSSPVHLRGTVLAFNVSPRGHIEGAMVETDIGLAQLNFPKHRGEALARTMEAGSRIDVEAQLESDDGDHPVYRAFAGEGAASGTIVRLNYALHGQVNGYHLDDGTFVHVKPEGAKKYKLRAGEHVRATGSRRAGTDAVVLEASAVERQAPAV